MSAKLINSSLLFNKANSFGNKRDAMEFTTDLIRDWEYQLFFLGEKRFIIKLQRLAGGGGNGKGWNGFPTPRRAQPPDASVCGCGAAGSVPGPPPQLGSGFERGEALPSSDGDLRSPKALSN